MFGESHTKSSSQNVLKAATVKNICYVLRLYLLQKSEYFNTNWWKYWLS